MHVALSPDINASPAELVYGSTLKVPGEFFEHCNIRESTNDFVFEFRTSMQKLKPTDTVHHTSNQTFVSKKLNDSSHVFVRNDSIRPTLTHPYDGPYLVIKRYDKFFTVLVQGRRTNISIDRLKPAFISHNEYEIQNNVREDLTTNVETPRSSPVGSHGIPTTKTTTSGRHVIIPVRYR